MKEVKHALNELNTLLPKKSIEEIKELIKTNKLENKTHYLLPNGASVFTTSKPPYDGLIYFPFFPLERKKPIHIYSPSLEKGNADVHVYFHGDLDVYVWKYNKEKPVYKLHKNNEDIELIVEGEG